MRQSTRKYVMFFGATMAVAGGLFAAACGTDNGGTSSGTLPTAEGGGGDRGQTPPPPGVTPPGSGDGGDSGTNPDCSTAPQLRSNTSDFFCAFVAKDAGTDGGDGGQSASYCQNNEICCNPSTKTGSNFDPSYCAFDPTKGTNDTQMKAYNACAAFAPAHGFTWGATDGGSAWECGDKNNCPSGQVCCLTGFPGATGSNAVNIGKSTDKSIPTACNAQQAFKETGTVCKSACTAGTEIQLCSKTDNCGGGQTCTAFDGFFRDLGICR
jgi:hypothetical protein